MIITFNGFSFVLFVLNELMCSLAEPAFLCREQVEIARDDGAVLWQWLYFSLHHSQAPDPEEVMCLLVNGMLIF